MGDMHGWQGSRLTPYRFNSTRAMLARGAIGTGLIAFNMACFDVVEKSNLLPWFDYDYSDPPYNTDVSQTEDYHFLHNLINAGGRVFCDWESWSEHAKVELVGKPQLPPMQPLPLKKSKEVSHVG